MNGHYLEVGKSLIANLDSHFQPSMAASHFDPRQPPGIKSIDETYHKLGNYSNVNQGTSIVMPQGQIIRSRARKLQQALILHVQSLVSSTKDLKEDVSIVSYMLMQVEF